MSLSGKSIFIIIFAFGLLCIVYKIAINHPEVTEYSLINSYIEKDPESTVKVILLWNSFFTSRNWYLPKDTLNETYFKETLNCPVINCVITTNRSYLSDVRMYHAVLFHAAQGYNVLNPWPSKRSPEQQYIFASMESPAHTKHNMKDEIYLYNLTMTYRLDSDILWPYNGIKEIDSKQLIAPSESPLWMSPKEIPTYEESKLLKIANGKKKFGAWYVSHCKTHSQRENLIKKLQKYITVDVYGKCGNLTCAYKSEDCNKSLDEDYKFYFSFENSLCKDYVTEKFFNALKRLVIPVVFGGADYTRFAPPYSYINAANFNTPKELANHLIYLSENPKEYIKYFWWKKHYEVSSYEPSAYCQICSLLNSEVRREKFQTFRSIEDWWFGGHTCHKESKIIF